MLTGRQIREAREMLGMNHSVLAQRIRRLTTLALRRAEASEDEATLSAKQDAAVRQTLERLGVEIGPLGVRLRVTDDEASEVGNGYLPARNDPEMANEQSCQHCPAARR